MEKYCKHCFQQFIARRKNHLYCSSSCKTMASYKRNKYTYVPGHYQKKNKPHNKKKKSMVPEVSNKQIKSLEKQIKMLEEGQKKSVNTSDVSNAAIGSLASDAAIYGFKKAFAPNTLPATKGDVEHLKNEIEQLKRLLRYKNNNPWG